MAPPSSAVNCGSRNLVRTPFLKNRLTKTTAFGAPISVSILTTGNNCDQNINTKLKLISCKTTATALPSLPKPKVSCRELLESYNYEEKRHVTAGFDIEFDLGDSPHIVRPWRGSLDDPEVTNPARFAVDQYNKSMDGNMKFEQLVKANYRASGDAYFLTFEASTGDVGPVGGAKEKEKKKKKRYRALVVGNNKDTKMELMDFYLHDSSSSSDDNFGETYMEKVPYFMEKRLHGDYFKYQEQVEATQGIDADEKLELKNCAVSGTFG